MALSALTLASLRHFTTSSVPMFTTTHIANMSRRAKKEPTFVSQFHNPVADLYGADAYDPEIKGHVADKKPFRVRVKKYHLYDWCGCGRSHSQPFCDHTCKDRRYLDKELIQGGPVKYVAPEDRDVWFCMCKHTSHRPFCDGSHRHPDIQEVKLEGKFNLWDPTSDVKVDKTVIREDDISDEELLFGDLEDEKAKK